MRAWLALLAIVSVSSTLAAEEGRWSGGFGQGNLEHIVNNGPGNQLIINCDSGATDDNERTGILVTIVGQPPAPNSEVRFILDGEEFRVFTDKSTIIGTDCHSCSDNFVAIWNKLRRSKTLLVQLSDGRSSNFGLKGVAKELGPKACRTAFMGK